MEFELIIGDRVDAAPRPKNVFKLNLKFMHGDADAYTYKEIYFDCAGQAVEDNKLTLNSALSYCHIISKLEHNTKYKLLKSQNYLQLKKHLVNEGMSESEADIIFDSQLCELDLTSDYNFYANLEYFILTSFDSDGDEFSVNVTSIKESKKMIIEQIKNDLLSARKAHDTLKSALLSTLFAEIQSIGKNQGDRETYEDEAIKVVQKFLKGVIETLTHVQNVNSPNAEKTIVIGRSMIEKEILESYLPKMASADEVRQEIAKIKASGVDPVSKMGIAMKMLKVKFGAALDGKMASQLLKE